MSTRTYLSIGDVLSLLREEFPDVTISKIRFLESQGLVNPERSPSGYRKFYEADVERLRWVLRQQREHFLPLKVIRDRLDQEGGGVPVGPATSGRPAGAPGDPAVHVAEVAPVPAVAQAAAASKPSPVPATAGSTTGVLGPRSLPEPNGEGSPAQANGGLRAARADEPAVARTVGVASPTVATGGSPSHGARQESAGLRAEVGHSRPAPTGETLAGPAAPRALDPDPIPPAAQDRQPAGSEAPPGPTPAVPAPDQPPRPSPRREAASQPVQGETAGARPKPAGPTAPVGPGDTTGQAHGGGAEASPDLTGASLTIEELCAASGLPMTEVASLEGFGLVEPMSVAGVLYYDEEALAVAKLVASYRRYGIEPRHLRLYRNAVDREMGLVEQIVTPLLRQRNPEARNRAADAAADLAKLGQQLRGSLLRREIRRQLGS